MPISSLEETLAAAGYAKVTVTVGDAGRKQCHQAGFQP